VQNHRHQKTGDLAEDLNGRAPGENPRSGKSEHAGGVPIDLKDGGRQAPTAQTPDSAPFISTAPIPDIGLRLAACHALTRLAGKAACHSRTNTAIRRPGGLPVGPRSEGTCPGAAPWLPLVEPARISATIALATDQYGVLCRV